MPRLRYRTAHHVRVPATLSSTGNPSLAQAPHWRLACAPVLATPGGAGLHRPCVQCGGVPKPCEARKASLHVRRALQRAPAAAARAGSGPASGRWSAGGPGGRCPPAAAAWARARPETAHSGPRTCGTGAGSPQPRPAYQAIQRAAWLQSRCGPRLQFCAFPGNVTSGHACLHRACWAHALALRRARKGFGRHAGPPARRQGRTSRPRRAACAPAACARPSGSGPARARGAACPAATPPPPPRCGTCLPRWPAPAHHHGLPRPARPMLLARLQALAGSAAGLTGAAQPSGTHVWGYSGARRGRE